ncbi:MAG: Methylthioribose-1-phosphate isomerase, partial [uncultured Acetobacteraceae bacterium]
EDRRQALPQRLGGRGRLDRPHLRPDAAALGARRAAPHGRGAGRARHPLHAGARRAADRRGGGLRRGAGAAARPVHRRPRRRRRHARADAAHGGEPRLGRRADAGGAAQPAAGGARRGRICGSGVYRRRRRRDLPAHRRARVAAAAGDRRGEAVGRNRERAHPLQRRLVGDGGLGHGALAHLPGARRGAADPRLGGRDPPAQPGRRADRLGAGPARGAAHGRGGQRRRPSHAARAGGHLHRRHRPRGAERRRGEQDRDLPEGLGGAGQRRPLLGGHAALHPGHGGGRRRFRHPDRGTGRGGGDGPHRPHRRRADGNGAGGAGGQPGRQPGLRRDAGAARVRPHHGARPVRGERGGAARAVPGQGL